MPANTGASSFLALPGEIRNGVYEALFRVDGGIKMVFDGKDCEVRHSDTTTILGTSFLATCQQVYTESVGVLYGADITAFSAPHYPWNYLESLCKQAATWLANFGDHASMLGHITIILNVNEDIDINRSFDVLPFLKKLWQHAGSGLRVTFSGEDTGTHSEVPDLLNKALSLLESDTSLNIQSLAKFPTLLKRCYLYTDGSTGTILYYSPEVGGYNPDSALPFRIKEGEIRKTATDREPATLAVIMRSQNICRSIFKNILPQEVVIFDLEHQVGFSDWKGMLWANRDLRWEALQNLREKAIEATITIYAKCMIFMAHQLRALKSWLGVVNDHRNTHQGWTPYPHTIVLRFQPPESVSLENLEVNALCLIKATLRYSPDTHIRVELLNCLDPEDNHFTILLSDLRRVALVALSEFSGKFPEYNQTEGPQVWTNSRGVVKQTAINIGCTTSAISISIQVKKSLTMVQKKAEDIMHEVHDEEHNAKEALYPVNPRATYVRHFCSKFPPAFRSPVRGHPGPWW